MFSPKGNAHTIVDTLQRRLVKNCIALSAIFIFHVCMKKSQNEIIINEKKVTFVVVVCFSEQQKRVKVVWNHLRDYKKTSLKSGYSTDLTNVFPDFIVYTLH